MDVAVDVPVVVCVDVWVVDVGVVVHGVDSAINSEIIHATCFAIAYDSPCSVHSSLTSELSSLATLGHAGSAAALFPTCSAIRRRLSPISRGSARAFCRAFLLFSSSRVLPSEITTTMVGTEYPRNPLLDDLLNSTLATVSKALCAKLPGHLLSCSPSSAMTVLAVS